jgi:hypothetical protein
MVFRVTGGPDWITDAKADYIFVHAICGIVDSQGRLNLVLAPDQIVGGAVR